MRNETFMKSLYSYIKCWSTLRCLTSTRGIFINLFVVLHFQHQPCQSIAKLSIFYFGRECVKQKKNVILQFIAHSRDSCVKLSLFCSLYWCSKRPSVCCLNLRWLVHLRNSCCSLSENRAWKKKTKLHKKLSLMISIQNSFVWTDHVWEKKAPFGDATPWILLKHYESQI